MVLDETKENDTTIKDDASGVIIVVDKDLISKVGKITIDFRGLGFNLTAENELGSDGAGCSGCGSSCGDDKKGE